MGLSAEMAKALDSRFKCQLTNVPVQEKPVLIVFDYSPRDDMRPLSIAFDWACGPKCWLTETELVKINNNRPKLHPKYKAFGFEGRRFHPFSVTAFPRSIFENIDEFTLACRTLYEHIVWS